MVSSPAFTPRFGIRAVSTSLAAVWVAAGRRAGYLQRGPVVDSVHFEAPLAICRASGCVVTDLLGDPAFATESAGLVVAADADTHAALMAVVKTAGRGPTRHP